MNGPGHVTSAALTLSLVLSCAGSTSSPTSITNPTGSCVAEDDGARPGYSAPSDGEVWLPDCQNPLEREYYRVYGRSSTSAYTLPRLDGAPSMQVACTTAGSLEVRALAEKYSLCEAATSAGVVDRINDMTLRDAFTLARFAHSLLVFEVRGESDGSISPPPLPPDVLDACLLRATENTPALEAICEAERERLRSGQDIGISYAAAAAELARLLNELYGIGKDCIAGAYPLQMCVECGPAGGCAGYQVRCATACAGAGDCATGEVCRALSVTPYCGPAEGDACD